MLGYQSDISTIATAGYIMPVVTYDVKPKQPPQESGVLKNNLNPSKPFFAPKTVDGSIVVPCDSTSLGWWLRALFGAPTTTGTGPYTHVFKKGATTEQAYLTLEQALTALSTAKYMQTTGAKINNWSMSFGEDGELLATFDVLGADHDEATSSFDASPTDATSYTQLFNTQGAIQEGGSASSTIVKMDFAAGSNIDPIKAFNGDLAALPEGKMVLAGNVTAMMDDAGDTLLGKADGGVTETSLKVTLTSSSSSAMEIYFPEVFLERTAPGIPTPGGLVYQMAWGAFYDDATEGTAIQVTLTNSQSAY